MAANYLHSGISLADAPSSEHGLRYVFGDSLAVSLTSPGLTVHFSRYTTLGANVAQVADMGLGAFENAYKNMGLMSGTSLALSEAVNI